MPRKTAPWTILHSEDGDSSVVVPSLDTDVIDALLVLVEEEYGSDPPFKRDNPALVKAAAELKVQQWYSVTKAQAEAEGIDTEGFLDFYTPNGAGKRSVFVVSIEASGYYLGEQCDEAEAKTADLETLTLPETETT